MSQDDFNATNKLNPHFQTPFKNTSYHQQEGLPNSSHRFFSELFSSGGGKNNLNNNNQWNSRLLFSGGSKKDCGKIDCKCTAADEIFKNLIYSPSSNFIFQSPTSLEKYIDSYSRERINVMKLVKVRNEIDMEGRIIIEDGEDKENSSPNFKKENNSNCSSERSENKFSRLRSFENPFMNDNFNNFEENECEARENKENFQPKLNLLEKFDSLTSEKKRKKAKRTRTISNNLSTLQDLVLNSPNKIKEPCTPYLTKHASSSSKKQLFLCSESKDYLSAQKSNHSSLVTDSPDPTLFSTQKKNRKRLRKSSDQLDILKHTYKQNPNKEWTKETITDISLQIGLPESKVYKWLWDQKNKEINEKRKFHVFSDKKTG